MSQHVIADIAFDLTLEHGRCVGVRIPAAGAALDALARAALSPDEQARAAVMPGPRRRTWVGGRAAMREALTRAGLPPVVVPSDDRGAPVLPAGVSGSVTHKEALAAALVATESRARVGVDLELDIVRSQDIASRILTPDEIAEIAHLDADERAREVLLRFSAKEAVYKALDPFVRRYVGFREIALSPRADGTAPVTSGLPASEGPFVFEVRWRRFDGIVLTTARVTPSG
jgi:enterobactin synthetase component D / holo-[acyl-carrier protein] synthase